MKKLLLMLTFIPLVSIAGSQYFAKPSEASARLILQPNKSTQRLFPVVLRAVNGEQVASRGSAVWLKPGEYELSFSAMIDATTIKGTTKSLTNIRSKDLKNTLTLNVQDDKTYYIAFDANSSNRVEWQPIVWKTE